MRSVNFCHQQDSKSSLKEALVTGPLSASGLFASTTSNQTNYPDLDSDLSSLWNYYNRFSDVCQGQTSWDVTVSPQFCKELTKSIV